MPKRGGVLRRVFQPRVFARAGSRLLKLIRCGRDLLAVWRSGLFDRKYYLKTNPDVSVSGVNPLIHFLRFGWKEGRNPNIDFDLRCYLAANPDVRAAGVNPLVHYVRAGAREGRRLLPSSPPPGVAEKPGRRPAGPSQDTVVFFGHDAHRLGAETVLLHMLRWLKEKTALDVRLVLAEGGELLDDFRGVCKVLVLQTLFRAGTDRTQVEHAIRAHCGDHVKLVYANTVASGRYLKFFECLGAPILTHVHELQNVIQGQLADDAKEMLRRCTRYVGVSRAVSQNLITNHAVAADKIDTIYAFVAQSGVTPTPQAKREARRKLGLGEDHKVEDNKVLVFGCGAVYSRKGSDLFVAVAEKLLGAGIDNFHFYWIGPFVPGEEDRIQRDIQSRGVGSHVTFLGPKANPREWFSAGDVFLLPSREDPFPLVCLEAAECGMPTVCFAEAGGMPDFVEDDAGFVVPFEDVEQMAQKTALMIRDERLRQQLGSTARRKFLNRHTAEKAMPRILQTIRQTGGIAPKVSVVVPCYNHASFLQQRLDSVFGQTFQDFEVIILDDCSPDNTREIIQPHRAAPNVRIALNAENSGNTFVQWIKGIDLARGEIVWLAEDDDFCEPTFLERLLPSFADRDVGLAYCQSVAVDRRGERLFSYWTYTTDLSRQRWSSDYVVSAAEELNAGLAVKNTIPNASAVLFRKFDLGRLRGELTKYRLAGDWLFYIHAMQGRKTAFCCDELNYHRRHDSTCIARYEHDVRRFSETRDVQDFARKAAPLSKGTLQKMNHHLFEVWRACFPSEPKEKYFSSIARQRPLPAAGGVNRPGYAKCPHPANPLRIELQRARRQIGELQQALELIRSSRTWRLRGRLLRAGHRLRLVGPPAEPCLARPCTIIVPVYNAFDEVLACLRSVLRHTSGTFRLRVIDDASPDGKLTDFLPQDVLADPRVRVSRNAQNLGFVQTCNLGMRQAAPDDVVLLNSDTEVTAEWLGKMQEAAYSRPRVGTVTPLTNNGTIASVPDVLADNPIPPGYGVDEFARLIERASAREYCRVPTCIGFCTYIKREVLDRVGYFDQQSFGKGYGEENDLSCRAQAAGYVDIIDDATFVYHKGRTSFQDRTDGLVEKHLKVLQAKHPGYLRGVEKFVRRNPLQTVHRRIQDAMLGRWLKRAERCILHVLHDSPLTPRASAGTRFGGTEFHVADLIGSIPDAAHWSLYPKAGGYRLTAHVPGTAERHFQFSARQCDLARLLDPELFDVVHLHHLLGFDWPDLAKALLGHGNYFVSLHDFRMVCPRIQLLTPDHRLCRGRECSTACELPRPELERLRLTTTKILRGAHTVLHFSKSTRQYYSNIIGDDFPWRLVEHGIHVPGDHRQRLRLPSGQDPVGNDRPSSSRPLKVAFLNGGFPHKGVRLVKQLLKHQTIGGGIPVHWHMIGGAGEMLPRGSHIAHHGRYDRQMLPEILDRVRPDLVAIVSIWPETYCLTLDESIRSGIPVICTPLGAPADRVRQNRCGWVLDRLDAESFLKTLRRLTANWDGYRKVRSRLADVALRNVQQLGAIYGRMYAEASAQRAGRQPTGRLAKVNQLWGNLICSTARRRRLAAALLGWCEGTLRATKLDVLATRAARRLLPKRVHGYIEDLRLQAPPPGATLPAAEPDHAQTPDGRTERKVA